MRVVTVNVDTDDLSAYGDQFKHAFDNRIMLNWYPRRIAELAVRDRRALELGIGHGYTCAYFAKHFRDYSVVDGSSLIIDQFKRQFPDARIGVTHAYFEDYQADRKFDVIIMGFVLEHVQDPEKILLRYRDLAAPGAQFFIAVPNAKSLHRRLGHEADLLSSMMELSAADFALGHRRYYDLESMRHQLKECGYRVLREEGIFLKPFTTSQLESLNLSDAVIEAMCKVGINYPELCAGLLFQAELSND